MTRQHRDRPNARVVALTSNGDDPWTVTQIGPRPGSHLVDLLGGASGPAGDLVVAWEEIDDASSERRVVAATHAVDDLLDTWDVVTLDGAPPCGLACGEVVIDAAGHATVAWAKELDEVYEFDLMIMRHGDGGWGAPQTVLHEVSNLFTHATTSLAAAPSGDVALSYLADEDNLHVFRCPPDPTAPCAATPLLHWPGVPYGKTYDVIPEPDGAVVATRGIGPGHGSDHSEVQAQVLQ